MSDIQRDREERQHVIEVLKQMRLDYEDFWEENDTEEIKAFNYAIASIETDLKYDLLYEETSGQKEPSSSEIPTGSIIDWNNCHTSEQLENISTTKNDLALIHTEGLDEEIRCTMCTNYMRSDRGCDGSCVVNNAMYKAVMDVIENHIADTDKMIEPTTKNDVPDNNVGNIDCISRKAVQTRLKEIIKEMETIFADIREREVNDSVCGLCEYDCDHGLDGFANECPGFEKDDCFKLNEKYKAEWLDISNLPSVPIRPKGHWIGHREHCENLGVMPSGLGCYEWCSNCDCGIDVREWHKNYYNYCPNCGAKMIDPQESEG